MSDALMLALEAFRSALQAWVAKYGRLDIPSTTKLTEGSIPASLKEGFDDGQCAALFEQLEEWLRTSPERARGALLYMAEAAGEILGVPHLELIFTGARAIDEVTEGLPKREAEIICKIFPAARLTGEKFRGRLDALMDAKLASIEAKIIEGLATNPPKGGMIGFAQFLNTVLTPEDFALLERSEKEFGEERCNEWLSGVLTGSGEYKDSGDGEVERYICDRCGEGSDCVCFDH